MPNFRKNETRVKPEWGTAAGDAVAVSKSNDLIDESQQVIDAADALLRALKGLQPH